jgi:hypothetical protein
LRADPCRCRKLSQESVMPDTLVERLRERAKSEEEYVSYIAAEIFTEAADALSAAAERERVLLELLRRSRRYVVAHDYNRRGMQTGPPPVGGVLRDLIAAIDAALSEHKGTPRG